MNHDYFDTFITVAPDSTASEARIPQPRGDKPTVAVLQYEMLSQDFVHTQADVLFGVWLQRKHPECEQLGADEIGKMRREFFAKGQPCLRASPLTKTHGWGVIFNSAGKAALCAVESSQYARLAASKDIEVKPAMRSKRK